VRERKDVNRTREAGNRDEVEGVVPSDLVMIRSGAVGFIGWLGLSATSQIELLLLNKPPHEHSDSEGAKSDRREHRVTEKADLVERAE
jgi:hypothetical protein